MFFCRSVSSGSISKNFTPPYIFEESVAYSYVVPLTEPEPITPSLDKSRMLRDPQLIFAFRTKTVRL